MTNLAQGGGSGDAEKVRAGPETEVQTTTTDPSAAVGMPLRPDESLSLSADDLLTLIGDGVVATDMQGRIILFNRAAELMFGYSRDEVSMVPVEVLMPERLRDTHCKQVSAFVQGRPGASRLMGLHREVLGLRSNGDEFWIEASFSRRVVGGRPINIVVLRDISERKLLDDQRQIFAVEMAHRMKNCIAIIHSIISMTAGAGQSVAQFAETLQGRLAALASSNDLLMQGGGSDANLRRLLNAEISPFCRPGTRSLVLNGLDVNVGSRLATALGLIIHELAANCVKYGAFSRPGGKVEIDWFTYRETGERRLVLHWCESGGPAVQPPTRRGFGTALIERMLDGSFSGKVDFDYDRDGLRCRFDLALN